MADNTTINSMSGGDSIATDEISGVKHQRVKVQHGADGSATDASDTDPLPVFAYGENPQKAPKKFALNKSGALICSSFGAELVAGAIDGALSFSKFGRIDSMDAADPAGDIWGPGGDYTGHPTGAPEVVEVFSSDAADTAAGTGARTVEIFGLKTSTSTAEESETISLNGVTGVDSVSSWYRVYRLVVRTFGSGGTNAGTLTVRHKTTTANVFIVVPIGKGQSVVAAFTVPFGSTAYIDSLDLRMSRASGASGSAQITLRVRDSGTGGYRAVRDYTITDSQAMERDYVIPVAVPGGADIKLRAETVSDNATTLTAEFAGVITA